MPTPRVIITGFADEGPVSKRAEEQFAMCRALGLSYYSPRFIDLGNGVKNVMKLTAAELKKLKKLHADFEIQPSSIGSPIGKVKLVDVDDGTHNVFVPFKTYIKKDVPRAIEIAQALECPLIRGFSFYPPKDADPYEHVDESADRLAAIAKLCEKAGVIFGLEVEANLVGRNGDLEAALYEKVDSPNLMLIFDGANIVCQGYDTAETFRQYRAMKKGIGWLHIKDYMLPAGAKPGYVDEEMLKKFVPCTEGDAGTAAVLRDLRPSLPGLTSKLKKIGVPGVFLDLEPHLRGGGQFGGFSGCDGYGVALRCLAKLLDYVGIEYDLTGYEDLKKL